MQTAANNNRFLTGCSSKTSLADSEIVTGSGGLVRQLVTRHLARSLQAKELSTNFIHGLIRFADHALVMRDLNSLDEASRILMRLPVDSARQIGSYYYAISIYRTGYKEEANKLLESLAEVAPSAYRARAVQTLGANYHCAGELNEALRFQLEALRMTPGNDAQGLRTRLMAGINISIIKSLNGDHKGALSTLESLSPLVSLVTRQEPFYFYDYCNALATELGELGRVAEANNALDVALSSPYASAYPNWAETRQELDAKRTSATPSVVAINKPSKVIPAPQIEPQPFPVRSEPSQIRKRVFAFCWLSSRGTFHRVLVTIDGSTAIARCQTNRITLDQLGSCIKPRAPPASA